MSYILFLPTELLILILLDLDYIHILCCRRVSRVLQTVIDDDVRFQYKIELAIAGMDDGPPGSLMASDRLAMLRERQKAWHSMQYRGVEEIPMGRGDTWELYGGVLAQTKGKRRVFLKQLPSVSRNIESREWATPELDFDIRDFTMDPAQDLLVAVEHYTSNSTEHSTRKQDCLVHLLTLSGANHPAAPKGATLVHPLKLGGYSYAIQTSQHLLGVLITSDEAQFVELLIWNWKTGERKMHVIASELPSFAFLTNRYLLLAVLPVHPEDIVVPPGQADPRLMILDLDRASSEPVMFADLDYLCTFQYPEFSPICTTHSVTIRSDPAPHWTPHPSLHVPFHVAHGDRLFVITLWVLEAGGTWLGLLSLAPTATFLRALGSLPPGETRRDFPWDEWGLHGSRLIAAPRTHTTVWVCYVHGQTFVLPQPDSQRAVLALDFNPLAVRRWRVAEAAAAEARVIDELAVFRPKRVFTKEVRSGLPYVLRRCRPFADGEEGEFDAVMVSEDSLVTVASHSSVRKYRILTF
ncbi:uncharacterized protein BXZ73DRAFT_48599 [Epithele typhae]|uniref:uncharacterized protein n=1 Tax=Epithele typhae TaxID=378194 RepID=UPI0020081871|nr:uncharacterized protein BXZ73DRAFT_48599 [Epithele typhae]KAH9927976.1 hypothetical protein BXZ73DRAFT_48599 [Epithele typhae]